MAGELDSIVSFINTQLRSKQFKSKRFQRGRIVGIAELVKSSENGEKTPSIVDTSGECDIVPLDDTYSYVAYHRTIGVAAQYEDKEDFGERKAVKQTFNMLFVFYGDRNELKLTKEDIITGIAAGFPLEITKTLLASTNIRLCEIEPGSFNTDKEAVYRAEYNISEQMLKPNSILLSYSYQIVLHIDKSCFILCN